MLERFTAFYASRPFWAGDAIRFDVADDDSLRFMEQMSAVVFSHETSEYRLRICKDGMVMLHVCDLEAEVNVGEISQIDKTIAWWGRYLDYLNCLYFLLDSATVEVELLAYFHLSEITNRDAFRVSFEDGKWKGEGIASESVSSYYQLGRYPRTFNTEPRWDLRVLNRKPIPQGVFDTLFATFSVATKSVSLLKSFASIAKSIAEYKVGNYDTSLVLSWFVCESRLSQRWRDFLGENREFPDKSTRINSERYKKLLNGRDDPISVVSNLLELTNEIPLEVFKQVDTVRSNRNDIVHQSPSFVCGPSHCKEAIRLALELSCEGSGIQVTPNLSLSITGP